MAQNNQQIQLAKQAEQAVRAKRAVTAQQAERAKQASRAIRIDELKYLRQQNPQVETFLSNYNDPTELNSFIDALTNREAVSKKFGETWGTISTASGTVAVLSFAGALITQAVGALLAPVTGGASALAAHIITPALVKVGAVAAVPSLPAQIDVLYNTGIKPIVSGKPKEAAINTLINIGETMDFVTNPIKGLVYEGGEGFAKATGLAKGGRVNYDFDTGSIIADMLLEVVIDPMNWLDLGVGVTVANVSTKIAKRAVKGIAQEMVNTVNVTFAKTLGEITTEGTARITKSLEQTAASEARRLAQLSYKNLTEDVKEDIIKSTRINLQQALIQAIRKELPELKASKIYAILRQAGRDATTKQFTRSAYSRIQDITWDTLATDVIKGLAGVQHYSSTFQNFMTKGAMLTSGYGLGIEAAISGWKGIKRWANQFTINKMYKLTNADEISGFNLKQWEETKAIWEASKQYTTLISGSVAQRTSETFYTAAEEIFSRDKALIAQIIQDNNKPLKLAAELDAQIQKIHGYGFKEYIDVIAHINTIENNIYKNYLEYLQNIYRALQTEAFTKPIGAHIKKSSQIFKPFINEKQLNAIIKSVKAVPVNLSTTEALTTIKRNDATVTLQILRDPIISKLFTDVATRNQIGALLDKISVDSKALDPEIAPQIAVSVREIQKTILSLRNIQELYDNVAKLPIVLNTKGVTVDEFKRYIIDQIYGIKGNITELLANFETITLPALRNGLEVLLLDTGFTFKDHPILGYQIARVYKQFLEAQKAAGIKQAESAIPSEFISSIKYLVNTLVKYLPSYEKELAPLVVFKDRAIALKNNILQYNVKLANKVLVEKETILNITSTRHLSDLGYALNTVAIKENLDLFKFPKSFKITGHGHILKSAEEIGENINQLYKSLRQHEDYFNSQIVGEIARSYQDITKYFINPKSAIQTWYQWPAIRYLKFSKDPIMQFAHLAVFNQMPKSEALTDLFKETLQEQLSHSLYLSVLNPSRILATDFAWAPVQQTKTITNKLFNEDQINLITTYQDLSKIPAQYLQSFLNVRQQLGIYNIDRAKYLQNERIIKKLVKWVKLFKDFENTTEALFDRELAETVITEAREVMFNHAVYNPEHFEFLRDLKMYWDGELILEQSDKATAQQYTRKRHELESAVKQGKITIEEKNAILQDLKNQGIVDEFTELWERNKRFNQDYAIAQARIITQDTIRKILPKKSYEKIFKKHPEIGARLLTILTDPNIKQLTNEDYKIYLAFILHYNKYANPKEERIEIPYNLVPATYKTALFKYYYDVLQIDDIRIFYTPPIPSNKSNVEGWYQSDVAAININLPHRLYKDTSTFDHLKHVMTHESGHYILSELLTPNEHKEFVKTFHLRFIKQFGEKAYYEARNALEERYAYYNERFPDAADFLVSEELFTFSFAGQLKELSEDAVFTPNLYALTQEEVDAFSKELVEELRQRISATDREILTGKIREKYWDHAIQKSKPFPINEIKQITPYDPIRKVQQLNHLINTATEKNAEASLYSLFETPPDQVINVLAHTAFRLIAFEEADVANPKLKGMFKKFNNALPEGVHFIHDIPTHRYYYVLDPKYKVTAKGHQIYLDGAPVVVLQNKKTFNEFKIVEDFINDTKGPKIVEMLNHLDDELYDITGSHLGRSQGEHLTADALRIIYMQLPEEVRKLLPPVKKWLDKQFFDVVRYNESFLGSPKSKRNFNIYTTNQIVNARNSITYAITQARAKNEYVNTVFDSILSVSSPNSIWRNLSNKALLEALQRTPDYKLVILVYTKKHGLKVREVLPTSEDVIAKVKENGGWIVPLQTYKDMVNTVNNRVGSEGFLKLWSRIIYLLKAGYLMMPGAWMRNFIDTNIKSLLGMESQTAEYLQEAKYILSDVNELQKSLLKAEEERKKKAWEEYGALATKLLNEKDSIDKYILAKSKEGYIQKEEIQKWFAEGNAKYLTYEAYRELESDFLSQGISGNVMRDLYATEGEGVWRTITEMTGNIVEFGNKIENYTRLADYLYHLDHGADYTSALAKLAKTHFDYSFKSEAEQYVELLFPFTTFSLRNISYWIEQIEKHPWIMRNYAHLMAPHWDFKDYTPEELATNYRIQNQILYGQLKIAEFNDKLITFKANPSIQDAIQMFSDPINNVYEKLATPIAYTLDELTGDYANPISLIPVAGPIIQNVQTAIRTGSPAPSILSVQPAPRRTGLAERYSLSETDKYTDSTYRTPKYRNNVVYDHYAKTGISRYRLNMYPIIDVAHEVKMRHTTNVYNRIKNRVKTDVYNGVRYRMRLDVNRFR